MAVITVTLFIIYISIVMHININFTLLVVVSFIIIIIIINVTSVIPIIVSSFSDNSVDLRCYYQHQTCYYSYYQRHSPALLELLLCEYRNEHEITTIITQNGYTNVIRQRVFVIN